MSNANPEGAAYKRDYAMFAMSQGSGIHDNRVFELAEKLIDEQIEDAELSELEQLMMSSEENLQAYIELIQLQADLHFMGRQL